MIIDGHAHLILPVENHLALMETAGVEHTILFSTRIHPEQAYDLASLNDAPFGHPLVARTLVEQATSDTTVRKRVLGENIAELLGRTNG